MEVSLSQRKLKRLEWWKKKSELGDSQNGKKKLSSKKQILKQTFSDGGEVSRKRKLDCDESDACGDETQKSFVPVKKSKKRVRNDSTKDTNDSLTSSDILVATDGTPLKKKINKKNKIPDETLITNSGEPLHVKKSNGQRSKLAKNQKGYVIFVGNLPYHITKEDIENHFIRTGGVKDVRLLTDKITGKSRGCAYVEFSDSKSHRFGLRLHESMLGDRKINVEFTSRGRKTPKRTESLKEKNRKMARMKKVFDHSVKSSN